VATAVWINDDKFEAKMIGIAIIAMHRENSESCVIPVSSNDIAITPIVMVIYSWKLQWNHTPKQRSSSQTSG
jgi:hypothetical protein